MPMLAPGRAWLRHLGKHVLDRFLDPPRIDLGVAGAARFRLNDGEFVVAHPRQPLGQIDEDHEPLADEPQEGVAFLLAEDFVHGAEAVDVDEMDGELPLARGMSLDLACQRAQEFLTSADPCR